MILEWLVASLHLMALATGFSAVLVRGSLVRHCSRPEDLGPVLRSDLVWGIAGGLLILTGLVRAFSHLEKGSAYYLHQGFFHIKLTLVAVVLLVEIWPMLVLIRWRIARAKGQSIDFRPAKTIAIISHSQSALLLLVILAATAMARGITPASLLH